MMGTIRILMLVEAATFVLASLIHSGWLVAGYQHHQARIAERVIAAALLGAVVVSGIHPAWTRRTGLLGQGFALLGTLVGVFTIVVGVGPRTVPDVVYHVGILVVLALGLRVTARWRADEPG
jgi:prepilin signal peptidase PulO-like enzyme (type II secretory pathway)